MILLKIFIIIFYAAIFYQDCRERLVYWFMYPLIGVLGFLIQLSFINVRLVILNSVINLGFIALLIFLTFLYSRIILKKKLINESIGIGDVLLFIFLCFTFSVISFVFLFTFSLIFSLILHKVLMIGKEDIVTIPLAGYISLFFLGVYAVSFFINCNFLFAY